MRFFILLVICTKIIVAQTILPERKIDWSNAGCKHIFTIPQTVVAVTDFGAISNDGIDDLAAFQAAIAAIPESGGTVFIPAGTYELSGTLILPDSIALQGAGYDSVLIRINHSSNGISVTGTAITPFFSIENGYSKNSKTIICDSAAAFSEGDYIEIHQTNGSWDTEPATWATFSVGQINKIINISNDSIFLQDALNINYDSTLHPEIRCIDTKCCVEISCFSIERTDPNTNGTGYNISFNFASECRVHGIESNKSQGSHVMIAASSHISIERSYFHDAYLYDGSGTKGYGVTLNNHASLCLIENNIFNHLRHAMMTKHGANGNVIAYNYSTNPYRNGDYEFPNDYCGDISLHGHFSYANLFEGNVVQNIMIDGYWGPSGPYNTFFRNRIEYYGFVMTSATTDTTNIFGNEISGSGYSFPFTLGAYTLSGNGNLAWGNNCNGTISPTGTTTLCEASLYRNAEPHFWIPGLGWPAIGLPNSIGACQIPAQINAFTNNFAACNDTIFITTSILEKAQLSVFPNPASSFIEIESTDFFNSVYMYDMNGKQIYSALIGEQTNKFRINVPSGISGLVIIKAGLQHGVVAIEE